jgi:ATP-dependent DNA ligase
MVVVSEIVLVTRNARDKIQVAKFVLEQEGNTYTIRRFTGQFGGKITEQPTKIIEKGKAKRSVVMQAELEFNSLVKKSLDKGYKKLSDLTKIKFVNITQEELDNLVPTIKTDAQGNIKPQLAKSSNDCTINIFDKEMFCSRKIDGVRCLMKWDGDREEVISISRGGKEYDVPTTKIRNNPLVIEYLKENPNIALDGELYVHGWPLQKISGVCRLKTWEERCEAIEFWIFDLVDTELYFTQRLDKLIDLGLYFEEFDKIKVVEHVFLEGWVNIKKYHDKFVAEGFEGLVARKPYKKYEPGKRNSDWIKVKDYLEDSFEIVDYSEGLRPEDFCFVLKAKNGKTFEAKPMGTREVKEEYMNNMDDIIGRMGDVKYFALSEAGVPMQPVFKTVRYDI